MPDLGKNEGEEKGFQRPFSPPPPKLVSFIDPRIFEASLKAYDKNNFVSFLKSTFGEALTKKAVEAYKIGTSTARPGANVFWYVDDSQRVRGGKIMLYDTTTGKRQNFFSWSHSRLKLDDFNLKLCFFGDHLLKSNPSKNVGIVESEKTAIISSLIFPNMVWLASGGKSGLNAYKFESLRNRTVFLFPDLTKPGEKETCFELWSKDMGRIKGINPGHFEVSDYFESKATDQERESCFDLADYILLHNWKPNERNERNEPPQKQFISEGKKSNERNEGNEAIGKQFISEVKPYLEGLHFKNGLLINGDGYPAEWDLFGTYTDKKTKHFIRMAVKNPLLIKFREKFDLS
ncbi:MAG: DUF6371 domain-containing protein [Algoriphagus aquaeductus]|uniref:DUF6371 domain-containing protein n=1 Tax=Algoriphagus aquaeductus TaxID=475299 RepID=UPI0039194691